MQKKVFERTGLIPRSIIRTFDRFLQQLLPGTENLAIQEYRVSRYQILVSLKSLVTIICIPLFVNYTVKSLILTPVTEHFWNSREGQIFINAYQEKRAFQEMQDFSEKIFFESLLQDPPSFLVNQSLLSIGQDTRQSLFRMSEEQGSSSLKQFSDIYKSTLFFSSPSNFVNPIGELDTLQLPGKKVDSKESTMAFFRNASFTLLDYAKGLDAYLASSNTDWWYQTLDNKIGQSKQANNIDDLLLHKYPFFNKKNEWPLYLPSKNYTNILINQLDSKNMKCFAYSRQLSCLEGPIDSKNLQYPLIEKLLLLQKQISDEKLFYPNLQSDTPTVLLKIGIPKSEGSSINSITTPYGETFIVEGRDQEEIKRYKVIRVKGEPVSLSYNYFPQRISESQLSELVNSSETLNLQKLFQLKSLDIANRYNKQSILAITNLLGDFITFFTIYVLFVIMKPQIIILKSFLTESIYSLSDTTKSFLLILGMDLLVGFHSPRGWEIVLEVLLRHLGLPENENFILLFVALFPVFLDTVFKYWIFRYLNKISPSTVVTYHSMLE